MLQGAAEEHGIVRAVAGAESPFAKLRSARKIAPSSGWLWSGVAAISSTAISTWAGPHLGLAGVLVIYLVGVVVIALRFSSAVAAFAAVTNVLAFDFVFIPPPFCFSLPDLTSAVTCGGMLSVAIVVSGLTARIKRAEAGARARAMRSSILYALSRGLAEATNVRELAAVFSSHFERLAREPVAVFVRDEKNQLAMGGGSLVLDPLDLGVVRAAWESGVRAPTAAGGDRGLAILPLAGVRSPAGLLVLRSGGRVVFETDEEREVAEVCAQQTAIAIERSELAARARDAQLSVETERARSALLSSLSHDFRTPLATIVGAGNSLAEFGNRLETTERQELAQSIVEEGERLHRLLTNVLGLTRLEGGGLDLKRTPHAMDDVVDSALRRIGTRVGSRAVNVDIPLDVPLAPIDPVLLEQLLVNVFENALRYTPGGSPIDVIVRSTASDVTVAIADRGPGVPEGDEARIFEKFYRSAGADHRDGGVGLGLAICRAISIAHGGRIEARNRTGGGLEVTLSLPRAPGTASGAPASTDFPTAEEGNPPC